jgi:hypothetical protein
MIRARSEQGQWALLQKMSNDMCSLLPELIAGQEFSIQRLLCIAPADACADDDMGGSGGGQGAKMAAVPVRAGRDDGGAEESRLVAEVAAWGLAVERSKVMVLLLAVSAGGYASVRNGEGGDGGEEEEGAFAYTHAHNSWWLLAQLVDGRAAGKGDGEGGGNGAGGGAVARSYGGGSYPSNGQERASLRACLSLLLAPGTTFGGGGAGPGVCVGGGGTRGVGSEHQERRVHLGEANRRLYDLGKSASLLLKGVPTGAGGAQSSFLLEKIQRERRAAMASLQAMGGASAGEAALKTMWPSADEDMLAVLRRGEPGAQHGNAHMHLKTLHLLDLMGAYLPYCRSAVTEAIVSYLTAQHSVPSIEQYKELLPRRSGYEFDLHVYSKISETPALLIVLDMISSSPPHFIKCWQHVRSLLATSIGVCARARSPSPCFLSLSI